MKLKSLKVMLIGGSLLGCAGMAGAASIDWVDWGVFTSEHDINMTGTVVRAGHISRTTGGSAFSTNTFVVSNNYGVIDFEPFGADSFADDITSPDAALKTVKGVYGDASIYQSGGSQAFNDAMDCVAYNSGAEGFQQMGLTISNLTIGVTYQVQVFRSAQNNTKLEHNYGYFSDSSVSLEGNTTPTNLLGKAVYATGQFTADATTQEVWSWNTGATDGDPAAVLTLGAAFNAYVLLQEPFILPPAFDNELLPFSITSIQGGSANVITFPSQLYHDYALWGSADITDANAWTELTNGIAGIEADLSITNVQSASPYFYKVIGE